MPANIVRDEAVRIAGDHGGTAIRTVGAE